MADRLGKRQQNGKLRSFGRSEALEPRNLLAGDVFDIEPVADVHGAGCACPGCCGSTGGHYVGDGHDHSELDLIDFNIDDLPGTSIDADDPLLRADAEGNQFFFDPAPNPESINQDLVFDFPTGPYESRPLDVPILHSNPTAAKKIFLDFDGQIISGTAWNGSNNGNAIHAPAYSIDGDVNNFSNTELSRIEEIWNRVSEDFAPFNVDVTTEDPGSAFFSQGGQGIRVMISTDVDSNTGNRWYSGAGGVAYLNSWGYNSDTPVWVFENNLGTGAKNVAEAASHEVGHALSLLHDGIGSTTYYTGHGSGVTGWAPIMGVGYNRQLTQWSSGEYANATSGQNDLQLINNRIQYVADDHGNDVGNLLTATAVTVSGVNFNEAGIIHNAGDSDVFSIAINGNSGNISVDADPFTPGPNLDIELSLYDQNGNLIDSDNPTNRIDASLSANNLPGGFYYVVVDGVGKGTASNGYTDYGSLGQYTLSGSVQITSSNDSPTANADSFAVTEDVPLIQSAPGVLGNDTDPSNDPLEVLFPLVAEPTNGTLTLQADGSFEYIPDPNFYGTDSFEYMVTDGNGSVDTAVVTLTIASENDAPSVIGETYSIVQGGTLTAVAGVDDLLDNDSDVEGDALAVTTTPIVATTNGSLTLAVDGSFEYVPDAGFRGMDSFTYEVTDGNGGSATAVATIDVMQWGLSCDSPAPHGILGDTSTDFIYNPVTGLMTVRLDTDIAGDELLDITIPGPEPLNYLPTGGVNWTGTIYYSGRVNVTTSVFAPLNSDLPILQYATGLTAADFNSCLQYDTMGDTVFGGNNAARTIHTTVTIATDTAAPTASSNPTDVTVAGGSSHTIDVTFNDDVAIESADLTTGTVRVTGPNGYDELATIDAITPNADAASITATLTIPAAGGVWDASDDGTYSVSIEAFEITDTSNNFLAAGVVGSFDVDLGTGTVPGDFNGDGLFDCHDVDELSAALAAGSTDPSYDLDADGSLGVSDLHYWVTDVKGTILGDANLDFEVNGADFIVWNANKFQSDTGWCSGDFNGDGFTDGADFVIWNANKFQSAGSAVVALPQDELPADHGALNLVPPAATEAEVLPALSPARSTEIGSEATRVRRQSSAAQTTDSLFAAWGAF